MANQVKTTLLIISDTHGLEFPVETRPQEPVDVVIHCGDLTKSSTMAEYKNTLQLLRNLNAPLKLFIAGNHDLSLDSPAVYEKIDEAERVSEETRFDRPMVNQEILAVRDLVKRSKAEGIVFFEEGTHDFVLGNGAALKLFASPYSPGTAGWAFEYSTHDFNIEEGTDVVVTHGPPRGILDISEGGKRMGCPQLFREVARSRPKIHCFGHVHRGWGARLVAWRPTLSQTPSHIEDIDSAKSSVLEHLGHRNDPEEVAQARRERFEQYKSQGHCRISHCKDDLEPLNSGQTLFVNAATKGSDGLNQAPWIVDIDLPAAVLQPQPMVAISTSPTLQESKTTISSKGKMEPEESKEPKNNKRARLLSM
ncbi:calcineurin-like phosphoesterase [Colletotrichum higginsianum IMI 349063]|uniref:Calcineurin-like phosphoesterase n=1 Tax=Colletotrichum higginsianum (strain IMI 349063) TaxID=759273 RepID=A0A1B7YRE3_COLHI|nr:calcineurin-like phosphoesterase [Colletotrichum higginsianum IMI 349063]OBR14522.1 calcineurin-like phosphoesterase [Colletotrichum higginsianum IMI 349063]